MEAYPVFDSLSKLFLTEDHLTLELGKPVAIL